MKTATVFVEGRDGDFELHKAKVVIESHDEMIVEVDKLKCAFLLRKKNRRYLKDKWKGMKPFWLVREGHVPDTLPIMHMPEEVTIDEDGGAKIKRPKVAGSDGVELLQPRVGLRKGHVKSDDCPSVEDIDAHHLFKLVDDKAVGDYVSSQAFIPAVQVAIIVGAIAAVVAAALGFLDWNQAREVAKVAADRHQDVLQALTEGVVNSATQPQQPANLPPGFPREG